MNDALTIRTAPSPGRSALIATIVASIWAFRALMPLDASMSYPQTFPELMRTVTYSAMLSSFALIAWLMVGLARPNPWVLVTAAAVATGGIVAGIGNFVEESLGVTEFGSMIYGLGLFPLMLGLIGLQIALIARREVIPAIVMLLTISAFVSAMGRGPDLMPVVWFGFAAWTLVRRPAVAVAL